MDDLMQADGQWDRAALLVGLMACTNSVSVSRS